MEENTQSTIDKINIIKRQTTYTDEECIEKLLKHNDSCIQVIREYMGIQQNKPDKIKSISQEIYKQIRHQLDNSMKTYNDKNPLNIDDVKNNLS